jgi:hypothetical protein
MNKTQTIVAVYDNYDVATNVVNELLEAGFSHNDVSYVASDLRGEHAPVTSDVSGAEGAGFGAAVGGVTGAVAALAGLFIPGVGPIIAAGPLVALLGGATGAVVGAAAGAVTGGITASLVHLGVPEDEAGYYAESVRRGGALVTVTVHNDADDTTVTNILRRHNPVDLDHRVSTWREKGWQEFDPNAAPYTPEQHEKEREFYPDEPDRDLEDDTLRRYPTVPPTR